MSLQWTPIGKMNKRIELQKLKDPPQKGATGQILKEYFTYAVVWAAFRTLTGGEKLASQQVSAVQTHEITIRYRSDVQPNHRIVMGQRIFDIKDVRNVDEANIELRMRCTEAV